MKGISYAPVPKMHAGARIPNDDFMADTMEPFWGTKNKGRNDMKVMRDLGANTIRLYGNDPMKDHTAFLDAAHEHGMDVIAGFSDYPYTQMKGNCISTGFVCFHQIKKQYLEVLRNGFLQGHSYHPALLSVVVMNEPDLKLLGGTKNFCRALVSAFDAVLEAEKDLGVKGQAPNFTVAFSFGVCPSCKEMGHSPGIGQMLALREAMRDPESVDYTPKNDLWFYYQRRFMNSVNTANPAFDVRNLFLQHYEHHFAGTPVFIGEYHSPEFFDQKADLHNIMKIVEDPSNHLVGISFFEFQVRYDKGGAEMSFGMFGLDDELEITKATIGWKEFSTHCLTAVEAKASNQCGEMETGVDFVAESTWGFAMDHIVSPEMCCSKCREFKQCKAWTWVEDAGLPGACKSQCWVKGSEPIRKDKKSGVISGLPRAKGKIVQEKVYVHEALTEVFGGPGLDLKKACPVTTTSTTTQTTRTTGEADSESGKGKDDEWANRLADSEKHPAASSEGGAPLWPWQSSNIIKAISYDPLPIKTPGFKAPGGEDFMSRDAEVFWGQEGTGKHAMGRRDLWIMSQLGANAVRLYSADPSLDHSQFLEEAQKQKLDVIAGIGDYLLDLPGNCLHTNLDCFHQMKKLYGRFLNRGFLTSSSSSGSRTYHPALRTVVIMNKPDTKLHGDISHFFRALVSAFDGVLEAEKEAGVTGTAPNLTVTFSFASCKQCAPTGSHPGLGQMLALRGTMREPTLVQYKAKNNLWKFYQERFMNSVDVITDAEKLQSLFLDSYDHHFQGTPVFIGEYHAPGYVDQEKDLQSVMTLARDPASMLHGISFFEYQVRYDEGCAERSLGMFGLSDDLAIAVADMGYGAFTSWCLTPVETRSPGACNKEEEVAYETSGDWLKTIGHTPSAEMCCTKCKEHERCKSWTWIADAGLSGCPSQCLLHGELPSKKVPKVGAVSGTPHNRDIRYMHEVVNKAFGGVGVDLKDVCPVTSTSLPN